MKKFTKSGVLVLGISIFISMHSSATQDVLLLKDLTAVIALLAMPCGEVINAKKLKDNDHVATCKDGKRYRVFVNTEGRVVAEKQ